MPLLAGIFLGNLKLDRLIGFMQAAEQRRCRFANLKIDGAVFNLDDHIIFKPSIQRMKYVKSGAGAIILPIGPVQVMVVDKRAIENDSAVGLECARDNVGSINRRAAIG